MFIIYGSRTMCIKKYTDSRIKCEECGSYTHVFKVYQDYFHLFFIPFVPHGAKRIASYCHKCGFDLNGENRDVYLERTRTPLYMYSGILLPILFIAFIIMVSVNTDKEKKEYIANPAIGDVYLINDKEGDNGYYFMKIKDIRQDSVFLILSAYTYTGYTWKLDKKDYFNQFNSVLILKDDLPQLLDEGIIRSVDRDYSERSGFHVEKYVEME